MGDFKIGINTFDRKTFGAVGGYQIQLIVALKQNCKLQSSLRFKDETIMLEPTSVYET